MIAPSSDPAIPAQASAVTCAIHQNRPDTCLGSCASQVPLMRANGVWEDVVPTDGFVWRDPARIGPPCASGARIVILDQFVGAIPLGFDPLIITVDDEYWPVFRGGSHGLRHGGSSRVSARTMTLFVGSASRYLWWWYGGRTRQVHAGSLPCSFSVSVKLSIRPLTRSFVPFATNVPAASFFCRLSRIEASAAFRAFKARSEATSPSRDERPRLDFLASSRLAPLTTSAHSTSKHDPIWTSRPPWIMTAS